MTTAPRTATLISSGLSVLGTAAVMYTVVRLRNLRVFRRFFSVRLLTYLAIVDFFAAAQHFIPNENQHACVLQGIATQYFFLASFLWILTIALNQFRVQALKEHFPEKYEVAYHIVNWIAPAISVFIILAFNGFGDAGIWCWIKVEKSGLRWGLFYGPLIAIIFVIAFMYLSIYYELRSMSLRLSRRREEIIDQRLSSELLSSNSDDSDAKPLAAVDSRISQAQMNMSLYLLAFLIIRFPSILNRLFDLFHHTNSSLYVIIAFLHALCSPLQGFINGLLFWNSNLIQRFLKMSKHESMNLIRDSRISTNEQLDDQGQRTNTFFSEMEIIPKENDVDSKDDFQSWKIHIVTWNLGKYDMDSENLNLLFPFNDSSPDVVVVGLQECIQLSWLEEISECVKNYNLLCSEELSGTRIAVWLKSTLIASNLAHASEATGLGNVYHNKGAVAISFRLSSSTTNESSILQPIDLCFLNCHLAAHKEKLLDRNDDITQIMKRLKFTDSNNDSFGDFTKGFDCTFLFGDLNYRIDEFGHEDCLAFLRTGEIETLLEEDQLLKVLKSQVVLSGFREAPITFFPSFKFKRGISGQEYTQHRDPAWCDRILHKSHDFVRIQNEMYRSVPELTSSDHKPVMAHFSVSLKSDLLNFDISDMKDAEEWQIEFEFINLIPLNKDSSWDYSEPYITFVGSLLNSKPSSASSVINRNSFRWTSSDIPKLNLTGSLWDIRRSFITFVFRDGMMVGEQDLIGTFSMEMYGILPDRNSYRGEPSFSFKAPVTLGSSKIAMLSGKYKVRVH